jgi:hypothetical protein
MGGDQPRHWGPGPNGVRVGRTTAIARASRGRSAAERGSWKGEEGSEGVTGRAGEAGVRGPEGYAKGVAEEKLGARKGTATHCSTWPGRARQNGGTNRDKMDGRLLLTTMAPDVHFPWFESIVLELFETVVQ